MSCSGKVDTQKALIKQLQKELKDVKEDEKKARSVIESETKNLEALRKSLQEQQV